MSSNSFRSTTKITISTTVKKEKKTCTHIYNINKSLNINECSHQKERKIVGQPEAACLLKFLLCQHVYDVNVCQIFARRLLNSIGHQSRSQTEALISKGF